MSLNLDIVDLLIDCASFNPEAYAARELRHADGRLFTQEEHHLVGQATRAELQAVHDYWTNAAEHHRQQQATLGDLADLLAPYFTRFGNNATIGELRPLMTPHDRARLDQLTSSISAL